MSVAKSIGSALLLILIFIYSPSTIYGDFTFSLSKSSFSTDETITANTLLSVQGGAGKTYYLEGALKSSTLTNYFGQTWNDSSWIPYSGSSNYTSFKAITLDANSSWSGTLLFKVDTSSAFYTGPGEYTLKLIRFTTSGNDTPSSTISTITITQNTQSPTPSPSTSPTPTPTPTSSASPSPSPSPENFVLSGVPSSLETTQGFILNIVLNNLTPNSTYYLKGAFKKSDSTNYFGQTKVGNDWIKNSSTYSSQYRLDLQNSTSWTGQLSLMPDPADSGYTGSGAYLFKLARYDNAGNNLTWSAEYSLQLNGSPTTNTTQSSPSPSPTPSPSIKPTPQISPSPIIFDVTSKDVQIASIAGISTETSPSPTPELNASQTTNPFFNPTIWYFLGGSTFLISASMIGHRAYKIRRL